MTKPFPNVTVIIKKSLIFSHIIMWGLVWLSIQPGSISHIFEPSLNFSFFNAVRVLFPFMAALMAGIMLLLKLLNSSNRKRLKVYGPLTLTVAYGFIGLIALSQSPDWSTSLYWCLLYLVVPLVLLHISSTDRPADLVCGIISFNWFVVAILAVGFLVIAMYQFDIISILVKPSYTWKCEGIGSWFVLTSGYIRSTGVGRFAAIAALVAFSLMWGHGRSRWLWIPVVYVMWIFLLSTGARTSIIGLLAGISVISLLNFILMSKQKMMLVGIGLVVAVSIVWGTGAYEVFLKTCIFKEYDIKGITYLKIKTPESSGLSHVESDTVGGNAYSVRSQSIEPPSIDINSTPIDAISALESGGMLASEENRVANLKYDDDRLILNLQELGDSQGSIKSDSEIKPNQSKESDIEFSNDIKSVGKIGAESYDLSLGFNPEASREVHDALPESGITPSQSGESEYDTVKNQSNKTTQSTKVSAVPSEQTDLLSFDEDNAEGLVSLKSRFFPTGFLTLSGRTHIWVSGWDFIRLSPIIGYGFHADRLVLGTHIHNVLMHALIQTGFVGATILMSALLWVWFLALKSTRKLVTMNSTQRTLVIQTIGVLVFLSVRSILESTGAFFGIDWILLAPLILYIQISTRHPNDGVVDARV